MCKSSSNLDSEICKCGVNLKKIGRYRVRVRLPNGRWLSKVVDGLEQARGVEAKYRADKIKADVHDVWPGIKLSEAWRHYYRWAEINKRSHKDDLGYWTRHIKPQFGHMSMDAIQPQMIQRWVDELRFKTCESNYRKGQLLKPSSIKHFLVLLSRLYSWSTKQRLYNGMNPCKVVSPPRFDNTMNDALSEDGILKLLNVLKTDNNERACLVAMFALATGRRKSEILHLTFDDINYKAGLATFKGQYCKNGRTQTVTLNATALGVLERCREIKISELVFPSSTGDYYQSFPATWRRIRDKAGINCRFHGLRHSFASFLASSQVDLYVIKELLGHKDLAMTQRYAHLVNASLRRGASVADNIFNGQAHK